MTENGSLRVNEHLQLPGFSNLYVIGDCADINESKMAYHAGLHARVAVNNIVNSLTGKPLTAYQPGDCPGRSLNSLSALINYRQILPVHRCLY